MKLDFDSDEDSISQAYVLFESLAQWLSEQPEQPLRRGKASFSYRPDGTLDSITITLVDGE